MCFIHETSWWVSLVASAAYTINDVRNENFYSILNEIQLGCANVEKANYMSARKDEKKKVKKLKEQDHEKMKDHSKKTTEF